MTVPIFQPIEARTRRKVGYHKDYSPPSHITKMVLFTMRIGGPNGIRTHDLRNASAALFRLSYRPSSTSNLNRRTFFGFSSPLSLLSPLTSPLPPGVRVAASVSTNAGANQHHLSCSRNQIQEAYAAVATLTRFRPRTCSNTSVPSASANSV